MASHQAATRDLWDRLAEFDVYISGLVIAEAGAGDAGAARLRLAAIDGLDELLIDDDARQLAERLVLASAIPRSCPEDALHVAVAAVNGVDAVITWNFRHLNNPSTRMMVRQIVEDSGYVCPEICSPEELLGGDQ